MLTLKIDGELVKIKEPLRGRGSSAETSSEAEDVKNGFGLFFKILNLHTYIYVKQTSHMVTLNQS